MKLQQTVRRLATLAVSIVCMCLMGQAQADIIVFGSRDMFKAAIAGNASTTEGWDQFATGTIIPNRASVNSVFYTLSDPTANFIITAGGAAVSFPNGLGRTNNPSSEAFVPSDRITFAFPMVVRAFGVSFNTFSAADNAYTLTTDLGDIVHSAYDPFPGFTTGQFAGFISDKPFSSITISTAISFQFGLDDMVFVRSVGEPTILTLLALGALGLIGLPHRTKSSN
jgi:hypothetical protein